ncbi:hypothetical protein PROFUN_11895 [Planoprotostelium fungivorum]|uniref:Tetratricopeptide repeat protein 29 n=1 Tax=Planoprotostelium fungivorum TaxID=1890364 RepID=A0A2P6N930_9EUKA|nr:hypothetical protein PROFUN_11895 [Planoprotostelium fungivorum]
MSSFLPPVRQNSADRSPQRRPSRGDKNEDAHICVRLASLDRLGGSSSNILSGTSLSTVGHFNDNLYAANYTQQPSLLDTLNLNSNQSVRTGGFLKKQRLCLEMLTSGYIHSFVDFFYLTHQAECQRGFGSSDSNPPDGTHPDAETTPPLSPVSAEKKAESSNSSLVNSTDNLSDATLDILKSNLTTAEKAMRQGDSKTVIDSYFQLANYFQSLPNFPVAIHFYTKCLDIAQQSNDSASEGKANQSLGYAYEHVEGDMKNAIQHYEQFLQIAKQQNFTEDEHAATTDLVRAYMRYADQCHNQNQIDEEVIFLQKCLVKAQTCSNLAAEGMANYKLSMAFKSLEKNDLLVVHLRNYQRISRQLGDTEGEGTASAALADAFKSTGDMTSSIQALQENIAMAERTKQDRVRAETCCHLGIIYNKQGDFLSAKKYFELCFELARTMGDRKLLDYSRVLVGIARGNSIMHSEPPQRSSTPPFQGNTDGVRDNIAKGERDCIGGEADCA